MDFKLIVMKWHLDRRFYYVFDRRPAHDHGPYLAVVDDFGSLVSID
ncbi:MULTISPECIES: hypothetical protein [Ralstonia]|uniref:Uncharacterized protein n=2 Tax=Ralstonia TaxID=48736 RepID=A0AAD2F2Y0_9RALS|nr:MULTISPECIES: hypothetical protein [Ralstonia]NMV39875.1 hypothetical protein [Ralstonia insidiosa]CAJ0808514.1 hypothetical protein R77560_04732 [Ralstonia sp. LMG 18095]